MLGQLFELAKELLGLTRDVREMRGQLDRLEARVEVLATVAQQLSVDVARLNESYVRDIQNLELRLEMQLLRFEQRLPPPLGHEPGPALPE